MSVPPSPGSPGGPPHTSVQILIEESDYIDDESLNVVDPETLPSPVYSQDPPESPVVIDVPQPLQFEQGEPLNFDQPLGGSRQRTDRECRSRMDEA